MPNDFPSIIYITPKTNNNKCKYLIYKYVYHINSIESRKDFPYKYIQSIYPLWDKVSKLGQHILLDCFAIFLKNM